MKQTVKTDCKFLICHKKQGNKNIVTFKPVVKNDGYPEKDIELTDEQWNDLKYHFVTMVNDVSKESRLAYVY